MNFKTLYPGTTDSFLWFLQFTFRLQSSQIVQKRTYLPKLVLEF